MSGESDLRDYLYVSARKVVRMSRTLRTPMWKRVRDLQVKLGPVGATLTLDLDSRAEDAIGLVPEVERAIGEQFGIKYLTDPELQVGQWFLIEATPMTYGTPIFPHGSLTPDGVLFVGEEGSPFILGGSAEYLLDRRVATEKKARLPFSNLYGIRNVLNELVVYDRIKNDHEETLLNERSPERLAENYGRFKSIRRAFEMTFGTSSEPLTALARCLEIRQDGGTTMIVGTPLYVAFHVPR